jgi:PleD family two-component response regulator
MMQKDPWSAGLPVITLNIIEDDTHSKRVTLDRYLTRMAGFEDTLQELRTLVGIFGTEPVILVVDPSSSTREAVQAALAQQGHLIYTGADVENCITFITNKRPDLVLVNTLLLNRNELVRWARSRADMDDVLFVFYPALINP